MGMRHRVVVEVKAHIRRLADLDGDAPEQRQRIVGQRQQARHLVGEHLAHAAVRLRRAAPVGGEAMAPVLRLGIEVVEVGEAARCEEGDAHVADGTFDAAFLVTACEGDGARLEAVVPGKASRPGWNRIASPRRSSTALSRLS